MSPFKVVILSAMADNLKGCVHSVLRHESSLPPSDIIVVDDGAQADWNTGMPSITWVAGKKPFVFARNANIGVAMAGGADVVLMNDDARLESNRGFSALSNMAYKRPSLGILSAAIDGFVGNENQKPQSQGLRAESRVLAFICVYIPRAIYRAIGPLDERFVGYGAEDMDYCDRCISAGYELGILDSCVVSHGDVASTFRSRPGFQDLFDQNMRIWRDKKGIP